MNSKFFTQDPNVVQNCNNNNVYDGKKKPSQNNKSTNFNSHIHSKFDNDNIASINTNGQIISNLNQHNHQLIYPVLPARNNSKFTTILTKSSNNHQLSSMESPNLKLKDGHKCLAKSDVTIILNDNNVHSSRKIGLVQGDNGSYGFFVWVENTNDQFLDIEAIIPIDRKFDYQLVKLSQFALEPSVIVNENDLLLVIQYGKITSEVEVLLDHELSKEKKQSFSLKDEILLEYDPLMEKNQISEPIQDVHQDQVSTKSKDGYPNQIYKFILFFNELTEHFVSTLRHLVSVSHQIFTETLDFEWITQYHDRKTTIMVDKNILNLDDIFNASNEKSITTASIKQVFPQPATMANNCRILEEEARRNPSKLPFFNDLLTSSSNISDDYNTSINKCSITTTTTTATTSTTVAASDANKLVNLKELVCAEDHISAEPSSDPLHRHQYHHNPYHYNDNFLHPESPDNFGDEDSFNILNDFNRELEIQTATEERKNEYVKYQKYSLFIGTWNVNGQIMTQTDVLRTHFLAIDPNAPDFYAIGFQELDLSKEAFLFNDNRKEDYWLQLCEQSIHPDRKYFLLKKIRLIGMMLVIFAAQEFEPHIKNVAAETVGTGILGKMGNKGAVAIRFDLHDTSICFVNCHLAAHVEQYERRNLDFREINSRLQFVQMKPTKRIYDHDQIYWFGDLNYRIMSSNTDFVKHLLDKKEFDTLLTIDQLRKQMQAKNCFQGFNEGPIRYMPSYKYNPGTNEWDSSEKRRPPAWCDRILWRGENIKQTVYRSHPDLKDSDHKPVSALFDSQVLVVDHVLKRKVYEDVMKKLDKVENELLPQVSIDTTEINFGTVSFKDNICRVLTLTNIGHSRIKYRFINKPNDMNFCKPWLRVTPSTGIIKVKEEINIVFELNFDDPSMAYKFNYGIEKLADTLVLSLVGRKDIFITISGDYQLSCFGCSLDTLVNLERPISSLTLKEFQQCFGNHKFKKPLNYKEKLIEIISESEMNQNEKTSSKQNKLPFPKEIYALTDHLFRHGHVNINIFQSSGMENEFFIIRDALDSSCPNKINNVSEHSVAEALLLFLMTLPEPVIPFYFFDRIYRANKNHSECKQIYNELPEIHRLVFQYLMMFLQEICNCSGTDKPLNKLYIAKLFGPILIRKPPQSIYSNYCTSTYSNTSFVSLMPQRNNQCLISSISMNSSSKSSLSTPSATPVGVGIATSNTTNSLVDTLTPEQFFINFFLNINSW